MTAIELILIEVTETTCVNRLIQLHAIVTGLRNISAECNTLRDMVINHIEDVLN